MEEVSASVKQQTKNQELQKLIENKSLEKMFANIDTDENGSISYSEANPDGNLKDIFQSAYNQYKTNPDNWGNAALSLTQNLCKNYYASAAMTKLATNAVSALV